MLIQRTCRTWDRARTFSSLQQGATTLWTSACRVLALIPSKGDVVVGGSQTGQPDHLAIHLQIGRWQLGGIIGLVRASAVHPGPCGVIGLQGVLELLLNRLELG